MTLRQEQALERGLVQTIFRPCAELLVKLAAPAVGERLLDVGCGSAIVARVAVERQPGLRAAHGFDFEQDAVKVARDAVAKLPEADLFKFWPANAEESQAYLGKSWDVCIAQHTLQQAPGMLAPMREALGPEGRAVIATWPASSTECPAYDFLYSAADEGVKAIGMSIASLRQRLQEAQFQVVTEVETTLRTPPVAPDVFLKQYLEGKRYPPANINQVVARPQVVQIAEEKGTTIDGGLIQFKIAMNVIIATAK
jgi:ubiquinone/menaquinone biosynthesis C-methylase UbiE